MRSFTFILAVVVALLAYQNCSQMKFDQAAQESEALPPTNNTIAALVCSAGQGPAQSVSYYPTACLVDPGLPAGALGFEINNYTLNSFTLAADDAVHGTSQARVLYFEVATYLAPDSIKVTAATAQGNVPLLDICNIATDANGDITQGLVRPISNKILQFNAVLPAGTKSLTFDFTAATTPTYLGVWNLGEFHAALANPQSNPFAGTAATGQFRVQAQPLAVYNDTAAVSGQSCPSK